MPAPDGRAGAAAPPVAAASVTLRYWAAAKQAAGAAEEQLRPGSCHVARRPACRGAAGAPGRRRLRAGAGRCSFLVDGDPVGTRPHASVRLAPGAVVEALPPFAGG